MEESCWDWGGFIYQSGGVEQTVNQVCVGTGSIDDNGSKAILMKKLDKAIQIIKIFLTIMKNHGRDSELQALEMNAHLQMVEFFFNSYDSSMRLWNFLSNPWLWM